MRTPGFWRFLKWASLVSVLAVVAVFGTLGYNLGPAWYAGIPGAVLPLAAYIAVRRRLRVAEIRARSRRRWGASGRVVDRAASKDEGRARRLYLERTTEDGDRVVDERTWNDLAMEEVFREMDVCFTDAGRNELYRLLHHCLPPLEEARGSYELVGTLGSDTRLREAVAGELASVGQERDADPVSFLWAQDTSRDRQAPLYITMGLAAAVSVAVIFLAPTTGLILALGVFVVNMVLYYGKTRHLSSLVPTLRVLSRMMGAATRLASLHPALPGVDQEKLREATAVGKRLRGAFRWLLTGAPGATQTVSGDIFEVFFLYLKIYFAVDLIAYDRITAVLARHPEAVRSVYRIVGRVDALCAVASYRVHRPDQCSPETAPGLEAAGLYHPLLERPVANSVSIPHPGAVITGTNMAGKSTFLRTLGVNAILAQTTGACFARVWKAERFLIMTSIEKRDDPSAGKSFYYEEAERIFRMIESVGGETPVLLLIDELLSGTNSLERAGASVAILRYLARRNALTVAATHDVGIAARVADTYAAHFFTDHAEGDGLRFDYRLRPGIVQTRNAIKLLSMIGYPEDVVEDAMRESGGGGA